MDSADSIVERIMTAHWERDKKCNCWICEAGRSLKLTPRKRYLNEQQNGKQKEPTNGAADKFFNRWNPWVEENGKGRLKKVIKLTKERRRKINQRLKTPDWLASFRAAVKLLPLPSSDDGDWQPTFDWLIRNDDNVIRLLEGDFDWRQESKASRRVYEIRQNKAIAEREELLREEKAEHRTDAQETTKRLDEILGRNGKH